MDNAREVGSLLVNGKHIQAARMMRERNVTRDEVASLLIKHMAAHVVTIYLKDLDIGLGVLNGDIEPSTL